MLVVDALPRVHNRKTKPDAEQRVPPQIDQYDRGDFFIPSGGPGHKPSEFSLAPEGGEGHGGEGQSDICRAFRNHMDATWYKNGGGVALPTDVPAVQRPIAFLAIRAGNSRWISLPSKKSQVRHRPRPLLTR